MSEQSNLVAAKQHVRRVVGPTILMGDGLYFDFVEPDATGMTVEDYAWGIASNNRFAGQCRIARSGQRCTYNVAQHVVLLALQMLEDGCSVEQAFEGLMHESDEVPWPDFPGPAKTLFPPEMKELIKRSGDAIDAWFGVTHNHKTLVKQYDIRMLATEKRDLMPHARTDEWSFTKGYEPFRFAIAPWSVEDSVDRFLVLYRKLRPDGAPV